MKKFRDWLTTTLSTLAILAIWGFFISISVYGIIYWMSKLLKLVGVIV